MQLRFYFPLFQATQLLGGAAYHQEIKKLHKIGFERILPHIKGERLLNYPYDICIVFLVYDTADFTTLSVITGYILHLIESTLVLQSTDYRVVKSVSIKTKKVHNEKEQGCLLFIHNHINDKIISQKSVYQTHQEFCP